MSLLSHFYCFAFRKSVLIFLLLLFLLTKARSQFITTIAGNGTIGYSGDGGHALVAQLNDARSVALDTAGNIYIGELGNNVVRKVNTAGIITTIAGTGVSGFSGDGGPGTAAQLTYPARIAADIFGNIFVGLVGNQRIRKIDPIGIITTVAGIGGGGFSGDGGPATAAQLTGGHGVAVDKHGSIYVCDGARIRKVDTSGIITTIAGTGSYGFSGDGGPATMAKINGPIAVAVDSSGNVFIADASNNRVRKIDITGIISTIAGDGTAAFSGDGGSSTAARLNNPLSVALDAYGNLYIADANNARVRKVNVLTSIISTVAGNGMSYSGDGGIATASGIGVPLDIAVRGSDLYIPINHRRVIKIGPQGNRSPHFTGGQNQTKTICENAGAVSFNALLSVVDSDAFQTETWSLIHSPLHGAAVVTYSVTSTGDTLTPTGLTYTPTWGYTGADSFKVRVTDGSLSDTTTIYVTISNIPLGITGISQLCPLTTGFVADSTPGGIWSSSNLSRATIGSSSGLVTGVSSGTVTISYAVSLSCGMAYAAKTITVNPLPAAITGTLNVCPASTTLLGNTSAGGVWSSGATGTAMVGSTSGIVAGLTAGAASITYTLPTGCYTVATVTVNPLPTTILGPASVCTGQSISLTNGSSGGSWSKNNSNINIGSTGTVTGVSGGVSMVTYTLPTGCYTTKGITVNTSPGAISGTTSICPGGTATLSNPSPGGMWASGNTAIATIGSMSGIAAGVAAGSAVIDYTLPTGCATTTTVTVNTLPAPFTVTGGGSYCAGSAGLHVGMVLSSNGVSYQLYRSGTPIGISVSGTGAALDFGLHTAAGSYTVTATNTTTGCTNNMSSSATISINPLPAPISGAVALCSGSSTALATGPAGGTWTSSNAGVATIGSSTGVVNGLTIGSTVITYTLPTTCSVTTTVNVSTAPTAITGAGTVCTGAMTVLASSPAGGLWSSSNTTRAMVSSTSGEVTGAVAGTVTITYSLGTGCIVTKVMTVMPSPAAITGTGAVCAGASTMLITTTSGGTWSSSTTGIATVTSTGTVNGVTAGMAVISYTASGCSTITIVTVNPVPTAIGGPSAVCVGGSVTETNTVAGGVWSTTSANINIGSSNGVVTGVSAGTAGITYSIGSCTVTRTITVNAAPTISGAGGVCVSGSATLTVTPASSGTWNSSSMTTATVSGMGVVAGVNPGVATITFTPSSGCSATKAITVNTAPTAITGTKSVCVGANTTLGNGAGGGVWSSGSTLIATINSTSGEVTGWVPGTANITYSLGTGCAVTAVVTVNPLPSAITGTAVMCVGSTTALSSGTGGGVWSSGSMGIATISPTGTVSGIAIGTATISYTNPSSGCSATRTVTVTAVPDAISGANAVCMGSTTILSNTTLGGTWTSSNPIVAAIGSATGVVSGVNTGSAVITYSLGPGCTVTKVVTVNPIPAGISGASAICKGSSTTLTTSAAGGIWVTSGGIATVGSSSGVVTGASGGAATISYTLPTGCASTYTLSVVAVPAISGIHNMCAWGDTMTVTNGLTTGSYSSALATVMNLGGGVGLVTAHSPGTATITYTIAGLGCSTTSAITVNPLPGAIGGPVNICAGSTGTMVNFTLGGTWSSSTPAVATIGTSSGAVVAIAGGSSTIVYTLPTGCKVDTVITVSTFPVAGIITGAGTVCSSSSTTLTMTGGAGSGGVWNSSDVAIATVSGSAGLTMTVTGITAGAATVTYTVTNVCGTVKAMKFITVNATPSAGVITGADSVCVGGSVVLTMTSGITGGVWSMAGVNAAVTSTGTLSGLIAGVDTVYYTVTENGCTARAMLPVRVMPITECGSLGVNEMTEGEIHVYPNPNVGEFTIKGIISGMADEDVSIGVINMLGQKIYSRVVRLQDGKLDAEILMVNIANGTYLLNVSSATYRDMFHITITR